ncbi:NEAT domain-containing protein [Weissella viridescens]|uniref:NEAT domain-containing protein n=1 Tax=Weissella viridescens TaxID=1629 RepID=UPI001747D0FF|nr:NEAT domain-containing protein [Weissella viridescens]MBX4173206.1 NEAT domain-containing protein [Weissella viridescens]QOD86056.1 NEAT domain-containing protein [Weissella viridescens]WJI91183.1 NEAT domain-containing protein [Weissella viridescens]
MHKKLIISLALAFIALFALPISVNADTQTVPLAVLKDGTNDTSYAASYFAHSANVTSDGNGIYTITSTVTTSKKLGDYPVQILSIDGAPANVSKADNGDSQTITYSYQTKDLSERHAAVIKVDVNNINYHHTYNVGLQLDASSIKQDEPAKSSSASSQADSSSSSAGESSETSSSSEQQSSQSSKSSQPDVSSSSDDNTDDKSHMFKQVGAVVAGGLGIGILAAIGTIWYTTRKK